MRYFLALTLSLAFHLGLYWGLLGLPKPLKSKENIPIELVLPKKYQKLAPRQAKRPKSPQTETDSKKADFKSDRYQRVKKQQVQVSPPKTKKTTQASRRPKKNALPQPLGRPPTVKKQPSLPPRRSVLAKKKKSPSQPNLNPRAKKKNQTKPTAAKKKLKPNLFGSLPIRNLPSTDLAAGGFTALNTDKFLYFSFFNRLEERLRGPWEAIVSEILKQKLLKQELTYAPKKWVTTIKVILDKEGRFLSASVISPSGDKNFDLAPITAFRLGAPIPNPPEDLIKNDRVTLYYQMNVYWGMGRVARDN